MAEVELAPALHRLINGKKKIAIEATTLKDLILELESLHPELKQKIVSEAGQVYQYVRVFVDGVNCNSLSGLGTPLNKNTKVAILVAMAGG